MISRDVDTIKLLAEIEDFMFGWDVYKLPQEYVDECKHYIRNRQKKLYDGLDQDFEYLLHKINAEIGKKRLAHGSDNDQNKRDKST